MLKAFKKLKVKLAKGDSQDKYPGGVCDYYCGDLYWSERLENQQHCAICDMIINIMQPHYDQLDGNLRYIARVNIMVSVMSPTYRGQPIYDQYQLDQNDLLYEYAVTATMQQTSTKSFPYSTGGVPLSGCSSKQKVSLTKCRTNRKRS